MSSPLSTTSFVSLESMMATPLSTTSRATAHPEMPVMMRSLSPADELEKMAASGSKTSMPKMNMLRGNFQVSPGQDSVPLVKPTAVLPPPYFRGALDAPEKRRAHSKTFNSFAQSLSFSFSSESSTVEAIQKKAGNHGAVHQIPDEKLREKRRGKARIQQSEQTRAESASVWAVDLVQASFPTMSSDHQNASARVVGTAAIFLRPLRYMFDVETDVAIVTEEESTAVLPSFEAVHVHLRAATRPPLMERDELLSGFLRAETPIHSSAVPLQSRLLSPSGPSSRSVDKYKFDLQDSKVESGEDESDDSDRTLSSLRGTYVWLLVRVQPLGRSKPFSFILPDAKDTRETLRVQYQISSSSESFCLPVDHTNVHAQMLKFTFLSAPLSVPEPSTAKGVEAKATTPMPTTINYSDTALAASEAAVAEETRRRKQAEAELAEAKSAAQSKDLERLEAQLQAKQDAQRAQELELARNDQLHARSLLEHELAMRDEQNQELQQARKQLEDQLQATNESAQRFQISISSTDQALEMLKQRALSDAKEREELQRRLRVLEEEKLALQKKSRACTLQ
ncbi:hypothetical protein ON010_g17145 [Phytophthora cinnamomi]|nr:hypothetical protein ON010_g17145 [Phytophthora cinnamomi]